MPSLATTPAKRLVSPSTRSSDRLAAVATSGPLALDVRHADRGRRRARGRPAPATTTIVSTYGSIPTSWYGTANALDLERRPAAPRSAPNSSAAPQAPSGVHLPKIIAASAMKPRPLVISGSKCGHRLEGEVGAAQAGQHAAEHHVRRSAAALTSIPTVSAASGCSPTARVRRPQRGAEQHPVQRRTPGSTARSVSGWCWNRIGPTTGRSPSSGIVDARQHGRAGRRAGREQLAVEEAGQPDRQDVDRPCR